MLLLVFLIHFQNSDHQIYSAHQFFLIIDFVEKVFDQWKYNVLLSDNNQSDFRDKDLVLIMEKEN